MYQLWQHKNRTWYVLYGPRLKKRISARTRDRREAEVFLSQFIAGQQEPALESKTVAAIMTGYEAEHGKSLRGQCALKAGTKALIRHLGNLTPDHLTPTAIKSYATGRERDGVKPGTILREITQLRAGLGWAHRHRLIERRPDIRSPVQAPPPRQRYLTQAEAERLLGACKEPHIKLFVTLGLMTAARSGAILEAKWSQVNFERREIDYGRGHGNKRRVQVRLNDIAMRALAAAKEMACSDYIIEFRGEGVKTIKTGFARSCERAGLKGVTPHVLRHTAATWAVMAGVSLEEVARMLGDTLATVERVYAKWSPDHLKAATDALQFGLTGFRQHVKPTTQ